MGDTELAKVDQVEGIEEFLMDGEIPHPKEIDAPRDKAREITAALVRQQELDDEAMAPSSSEHLDRVINRPLLRAMRILEEDNEKLLERMKSGDAFPEDGVTPAEARKLFGQNTKTLLELKNSVRAKGTDSTTTSINLDIGSVFQEALQLARDTEVVELDAT